MWWNKVNQDRENRKKGGWGKVKSFHRVLVYSERLVFASISISHLYLFVQDKRLHFTPSQQRFLRKALKSWMFMHTHTHNKSLVLKVCIQHNMFGKLWHWARISAISKMFCWSAQHNNKSEHTMASFPWLQLNYAQLLICCTLHCSASWGAGMAAGLTQLFWCASKSSCFSIQPRLYIPGEWKDNITVPLCCSGETEMLYKYPLW